jgi:hypothetical protein
VSWLVASAIRTDVAALRDGEPALWRQLRRYNAPVQLALAAAVEVAARARRPADAALISLAPCETGSPELHRWVRDIDAGTPGVRMNPTHTLHAVDNLALSVLAMRLGARGWAIGLGGAAGQLWVALELALERPEPEVIVLAGDQRGEIAAGTALLLAREPAPTATARLIGIARTRRPAPCEPHAADGACAMLAALQAAPAGPFVYRVPPTHGDGIDELAITWEVA